MTIHRLKKQIADIIFHHKQCHQLTQTELAQCLHINQPRVSDLLSLKLHLFSIDGLLSMLWRLGYRVKVKLTLNQKHLSVKVET